MAKATYRLDFFTVQHRFSPMAYSSAYNAFFMDLPVSSFVSHSSLLTMKSVDLAVACDGFPS